MQNDKHKRQIFLDTETTGFEHSAAENPDRMVEFAGVEMQNRQYTGNNLHLYINPQRDVPEEAAKVHGLTLDKLLDKPVFADVAQQIFDYIQGAELIIHNAKFDVGFLNAEFARVGLPRVETVCDIVDTLEMARERYAGQKNNLDALCNRLGVDRSKRIFHGALIDCELLGEVYLAMTRTQYSLVDDLDEAAEKSDEQHAAATVFSQPEPRPEKLKIICADEAENDLHLNYLLGLDKSAGGKCVYRQYEEYALPESEETAIVAPEPVVEDDDDDDEEEYLDEFAAN